MHIDLKTKIPYEIMECLPEKISLAIEDLEQNGLQRSITEVRIRALGLQSIELLHESLIVSECGKAQKEPQSPLRLTKDDLSRVVTLLCSGSVYAHYDEIKKGYISKNGFRIGVCGSGIIKDGSPSGFSEYYSLNIRIPHHVRDAAKPLFDFIKKHGCKSVGGVLVVSPPGCGKTTFLRSFAEGLSSGFYNAGTKERKKVCVIDERGEFSLNEAFGNGFCDFICHLPKISCITLATRTMSPDYIICDEIGEDDEACAIRSSSNSGIAFVASCHGRSLEDVMKKPHFASLFNDGIFSTVCELNRQNGTYTCYVRSVTNEGRHKC